MVDIAWTQIDSWHIIGDTWLTPNGTWMVKTSCGLERQWDQTFVDRLPGGSEKSCENCLRLLAGEVDDRRGFSLQHAAIDHGIQHSRVAPFEFLERRRCWLSGLIGGSGDQRHPDRAEERLQER